MKMKPMMTMSHMQWDKGCSLMEANWWWQHRWRRKSHLDLMVRHHGVAFEEGNRWLVWHYRVRSWKVGTRTKKSSWRRGISLQEIAGQRTVKRTKWKRCRVFQENTETTFCERSSDRFSLIDSCDLWRTIVEMQNDEMDDKIPDCGRRLEESWMDLCPATRSHFSCYCSRGDSKKKCSQQCTSCFTCSRQQPCDSTMDRWYDTSSTQWGYWAS